MRVMNNCSVHLRNKDLTDGQNISFRTLNYFQQLIGRKRKKDYERKKQKERSKI